MCQLCFAVTIPRQHSVCSDHASCLAVNKLKDENFESPYIDRLERKVDCHQAVEDLEKEILLEMGGALRKMEDKLNYKLLILQVAGREIGRATSQGARLEAIRQFNVARAEALDARRDMTIQREAAGMRIKNWDRVQR